MKLKQQINIIAPNIKAGGGKNLLSYLLFYLEKNYKNVNVIVYIDPLYNDVKPSKKRTVIQVNNIFKKFILFFKKIDNSIYFGNIPPVCKSSNSILYIHNELLTMDYKEIIKHTKSFKYIFLQIYIKFFINNVKYVGCQTEYMLKGISEKLNCSNVKILPFYNVFLYKHKKLNKFDFCYISLSPPHKNHKFLLDVFEILGNKGFSLSLAVTIEEYNLDLINQINRINQSKNIKIVNFGVISNETVAKVYSQSKCLVFPSLAESFGMPVIEAIDYGLDVIISDLPYSYSIVDTPFRIDPFNKYKCVEGIESYLNTKNPPKCHKVVKNDIDKFIKLLV